MANVNPKVTVQVSAVLTRADGTVVDLGVLSEKKESLPKKILDKLFGKNKGKE